MVSFSQTLDHIAPFHALKSHPVFLVNIITHISFICVSHQYTHSSRPMAFSVYFFLQMCLVPGQGQCQIGRCQPLEHWKESTPMLPWNGHSVQKHQVPSMLLELVVTNEWKSSRGRVGL